MSNIHLLAYHTDSTLVEFSEMPLRKSVNAYDII